MPTRPDAPAPLIYDQLAGERLVEVLEQHPGDHPDDDRAADEDQPARTAGEQDHSDPWVWAGPDADPPGPT